MGSYFSRRLNKYRNNIDYRKRNNAITYTRDDVDIGTTGVQCCNAIVSESIYYRYLDGTFTEVTLRNTDIREFERHCAIVNELRACAIKGTPIL